MRLIKKNNVLLEISGKDQYKVVDLQDILNISERISESFESLKSYRKKVSLNGLGYKCQIFPSKLGFKLNLSHPLEVNVPSYILKVIQRKKFLVFESYDEIMLGTFVERVYNLRPSDVYKFKGFYLESKSKVMKEVNKKNKKG